MLNYSRFESSIELSVFCISLSQEGLKHDNVNNRNKNVVEILIVLA